MHKPENASACSAEERLPLSMAAKLLADRTSTGSNRASDRGGLPARMYALMIGISLFTFAVLVAIYELLPTDQTFA